MTAPFLPSLNLSFPTCILICVGSSLNFKIINFDKREYFLVCYFLIYV